jgi:hypothetical protein
MFYNNFIVQHSFINQGLLTDRRPYWQLDMQLFFCNFKPYYGPVEAILLA